MSVYFPKLKIPTSCLNCNERDVEYGGDCELMLHRHFNNYEDQYSVCPIKYLAERYNAIEVPPHGNLIDIDEYEFPGDLKYKPVIIPAGK